MRRYLAEGAYYFVTTVTFGRRPFFGDPAAADLLLATVQYFSYYLIYDLTGYVVMPDHFHLLLRPSEIFSISKIMNLLKGNFSRRFNLINGTSLKHFWQKRYYDSIVRDERDLRNKLDYMHFNPVKAGLVEKPEDYPYSSYRQYISESRHHIQAKIVPPVF